MISDRKIANDNVSSFTHYTADIVTTSDYYPFGMQLPDRNSNTDEYRYGFQGQEKDDEIKTDGAHDGTYYITCWIKNRK